MDGTFLSDKPEYQAPRKHKIDVQRSLDPTSRATNSVSAELGFSIYAHTRGARQNTSATHKRGFPTLTRGGPELFSENNGFSQLNTGPTLSRIFPGETLPNTTRDQLFPGFFFREKGICQLNNTGLSLSRKMTSQRIEGPESSRKKYNSSSFPLFCSAFFPARTRHLSRLSSTVRRTNWCRVGPEVAPPSASWEGDRWPLPLPPGRKPAQTLGQSRDKILDERRHVKKKVGRTPGR